MAKSPNKALQNTKSGTKKQKLVGTAPSDAETNGLVARDCCEICDAVIGTWGIPWQDATGTWHCLPGPTTGDKVLRGDENGPYWGN